MRDLQDRAISLFRTTIFFDLKNITDFFHICINYCTKTLSVNILNWGSSNKNFEDLKIFVSFLFLKNTQKNILSTLKIQQKP